MGSKRGSKRVDNAGRQRNVLPDDVDVRPIPSMPGYLVTQSGEVYTDTDPPLQMMPRDYSGNQQLRRRVRLSVGGKAREHYVAGLVLEAWREPRPEGAVAIHADGDPLNCHVDNLFWGYPQSQLDLAELVRVWQASESVREVAERLGCLPSTAANAAGRLRAHGVDLKELVQRRATQADYDELARLARELTDEKEQ